LKSGLWVRLARFAILAPDGRHHRRFQAGIPLMAVSELGQPPLTHNLLQDISVCEVAWAVWRCPCSMQDAKV
jgi:hypothetical protein